MTQNPGARPTWYRRLLEPALFLAAALGIILTPVPDGSAAPADPGAVRLEPPIIRVFLFRAEEVTLSCVRTAGELWDLAAGSRLLTVLAPGQNYKLDWSGQWRLLDKAGKDLLAGRTSGKLELRLEPGAVAACGAVQTIRYRGALRFLAQPEGGLAAVNVIDLESYLQGVVGAEMPAHWPAEALRAQALASRTYALFQIYDRQDQGDWDLGSDQGSQVYGGVDRETRSVTQAVEETRGVVLSYPQGGREKIFPAYYSSICGGHTQDAEPVFGKKLPPLSSPRPCPYCQETAPADYIHWKSVSLEKSLASEMILVRYPELRTLEKVADIRITQRSDYGRVERVELKGSNGRKIMLRGEDFRLGVLSGRNPIRSGWYELVDGGGEWRFENGRGWGHGVGLCQYGTQAMAQAGKDCVEIMEFYYPQSRLVRAY